MTLREFEPIGGIDPGGREGRLRLIRNNSGTYVPPGTIARVEFPNGDSQPIPRAWPGIERVDEPGPQAIHHIEQEKIARQIMPEEKRVVLQILHLELVDYNPEVDIRFFLQLRPLLRIQHTHPVDLKAGDADDG